MVCRFFIFIFWGGSGGGGGVRRVGCHAWIKLPEDTRQHSWTKSAAQPQQTTRSRLAERQTGEIDREVSRRRLQRLSITPANPTARQGDGSTAANQVCPVTVPPTNQPSRSEDVQWMPVILDTQTGHAQVCFKLSEPPWMPLNQFYLLFFLNHSLLEIESKKSERPGFGQILRSQA